MAVSLVWSSLLVSVTAALCPHAGSGVLAPPPRHREVPVAGGAAAARVDWRALKSDVLALFKDSKDVWPADYNNYAPLFVRLAWHCSGSYRISDGRGGCDGGRQRFDPERSWDDNTNLDKARRLLLPLKEKYGNDLSWGDLFIYAGTTAIESMGGPTLGFCAGRKDDPDGSESIQLGPSMIQHELFPCEKNGECQPPLGTSTVGLIYVDPTGPDGVPNPRESAPQVRDTFGRMNMNDTETVALIGGGHAFGKTHGACPKGPGSPPNVNPIDPWHGNCGTGKGVDAVTSGMEGPWTTSPTQWDNEYFKNLLGWTWETIRGPGGKPQWKVDADQSPTAPSADLKTRVPIRMMTTDVSLVHDPEYKRIVQLYASDLAALNHSFAHAWYKLTTRDMGPWERCVGPHVPPPQPWQNALPKPSSTARPDYDAVREDIVGLLYSSEQGSNTRDNDRFHGAILVRLAWQCASTVRSTDYLGGCNGARIRFSPERDWPENKNLDDALRLLNSVKQKYGERLSWGDLIVLAGNVAIEEAGGAKMSFCPGRVDALSGEGSTFLKSRINYRNMHSSQLLKDVIEAMGISMQEFVVLLGGGHTLGMKHVNTSGYEGAWTSDPNMFTNSYFTTLLNSTWDKDVVAQSGRIIYRSQKEKVTMLETDMLLLVDPVFQEYTQLYAANKTLFYTDFAMAWTKVMNADRYLGPDNNLCNIVGNTIW